MLILILLVLMVAGLAIADVVVLVPLNVLQGLVPPMWLVGAIALGLLAWLLHD